MANWFAGIPFYIEVLNKVRRQKGIILRYCDWFNTTFLLSGNLIFPKCIHIAAPLVLVWGSPPTLELLVEDTVSGNQQYSVTGRTYFNQEYADESLIMYIYTFLSFWQFTLFLFNKGDRGKRPMKNSLNKATKTIRLPQWLSSKESACNGGASGDTSLNLGWGKPPERGQGNPLQCSCLENSMTEEPGGLQSRGSQRIKHDWSEQTLKL